MVHDIAMTYEWDTIGHGQGVGYNCCKYGYSEQNSYTWNSQTRSKVGVKHGLKNVKNGFHT